MSVEKHPQSRSEMFHMDIRVDLEYAVMRARMRSWMIFPWS